MPNWVSNTLEVIKGDAKEIFDFVRSDESVFDFNNLIPMPDSLLPAAANNRLLAPTQSASVERSSSTPCRA